MKYLGFQELGLTTLNFFRKSNPTISGKKRKQLVPNCKVFMAFPYS